MSLPPMPDAVLNSGTPEGTASTLTLTEDAWDLLGLGASDAMNDRDMHIKNGQVCLLTGGDYMNAKRRYALDNREAQRAQWRQQAEQRLAKADARRGGLDKAAAEGGVMKTAKFTWSKDGAKSFEWRKIYHALVGNVGPGEGGLLAEALITPTSMRMYTDHRVMGQVVLPGVSHVSLMAATASQGFPNPGGGLGDWHISVKEVLFERPYIVHSGAELIAAIANGVDPSTVQAMAGGLPIPMTPVGVPTTYCRATNVTKERGIVKSTLDDSERSYKDINPNQSGKMTARSFKADKHIHSNPKTKVDVFKPKCTTVFGGNTKASTAHDELEKVLKQSLEEFENLKKIQEEKRKMLDANRDLQKALELSRLEYTQLQCSVTCDELIERQVHNGSCLSNKDRELERALELSKLEAQTAKRDHCTGMVEKACSRGEKQSREREGINFVESDLPKALELSKGEYEQGKTKASMNLNAGGQSMETSILEGKEPGSKSLSSNEGDLAKAIQISRNDCDKVVEHNGDGVFDKEEQYNRGKGTMNSLQVEENGAKVLIQSFDGSRGHSSGSDLHRVLELSRGEYPKTTQDEKDKHTDADVVLQGSNAALVQSRERHELDQNAKYSTPVQGCVANGDVVPSRVPLELDQDHDYPCTFPALGHSTPAGSAKCSAILLDSQELGDERESMDASELQIEEVAEDIPANKKQLCPAEGRSVDDDYAYALKLEKELNSYEQSFDGPVRRNKTSAAAAEVQDQLKLYRESQKEKYGTRAGKGDKSSRGIDFRRNVAAIACGKPVQIGVANPISRSELSQRKQDPPRDHRDMSSPKKRIEREGKKLHYSPKKLGFHREDVFVIRDEDDDDIEPKPGGFPFSSRPSSSGSSTFERVHPRPPSFSGAMPSPSHPFHRSPCEPKDSSTNHVSSSSDKPMGPKCSSCGTVGHNKNSKVCPNYFSAEAVQRREEQSRKRKAKREEEEREFNDRLGALAAQRLAIEDRSRTLGEQLDELRRQSQNMANTQKMVEDAIKRRRKR